MVLEPLEVNWSNIALSQMGQICKYISKDSLKNAEKVRSDIFACTRSLSTYPEKYPLDKFKLDNDGTYRAFERHHLRIIYRVRAMEVKILRVRLTSMEPLPY